MNTPLLALPLSAPIPDKIKKKRVLLVDTSHAKRDLRAENFAPSTGNRHGCMKWREVGRNVRIPITTESIVRSGFV